MVDVRRAYSSRGFCAAAAALIALLVALLMLVAGPAGRSSRGESAVSVFPVAGSRLGPPGTQITFRGLPASQLGKITVTGSRSGNHTGKVLPDSDGRGGSFMPDKPFTPGERVTVSTNLNIVGGPNGVYHFTVATPAGRLPDSRVPACRADPRRRSALPLAPRPHPGRGGGDQEALAHRARLHLHRAMARSASERSDDPRLAWWADLVQAAPVGNDRQQPPGADAGRQARADLVAGILRRRPSARART